MNLQPVSPGKFVYLFCVNGCRTDSDHAMADLDAAPGTYYCERCAAMHDLRRAATLAGQIEPTMVRAAQSLLVTTIAGGLIGSITG